VAQLWTLLFDRYGLEITFAHRTFAWGSDARGMAHVHVVVIGLCRRDMEPPVKRLFSYNDIHGQPTESKHQALTPYLFDAGKIVNRHLVVEETNRSLCGAPQLVIGSKPIDEGHYIFSREARLEFLRKEPHARKFMHPFVGADEFLYGLERWILYLGEAPPEEIRSMPAVKERVVAVKRYRLKSKSPSTRKLSETPARFHVTVVPKKPFLVIPEVSSEQRDYVPIAGRVVPNLFERVDDPLYPPGGLREALANALCHRDYSIGGGAVSLAIYDDRLEISSTGMLPFGLTAADLLRPHPSRPWNPIVAQVFYRRGIIESWGRGTIKIAELNERAGLAAPEFETGGGEVLVRFRSTAYVPPTRVPHNLSQLQRQLLAILAHTGPAALGELRASLANPTPERTVQDNLQLLRRLGLVEVTGSARMARWKLTGSPGHDV